MLFEAHGDNVALTTTDPVDAELFGDADVIVRGRYVNQRMAVAPMEPHGAAAAIADDGRLLVYGSTQMPHLLAPSARHRARRWTRARSASSSRIVGGGFGGKAGIYPEQVVVAAAARRLQRPVVWTATRSEDMLALSHSRGQIQYVELGCKRDGTFTGLRVRLVGDGGAYPGIGAFLPAGTRRMSNGTYRFTGIQFDVAVAATNTTPMGAYRGAGRPEATALLERVVDQAAIELGIDPIELRRRNLLADDVFPFTTLTGITYDSGAYTHPARRGRRAGRLRRAAPRAGRPPRAAATAICWASACRCYVEITAGGGTSEYAGVEVHDDGIGHRDGRHVGARAGPPDRVRDDRQRTDRHPRRPHPARRRSTPTSSAAAAAPAGRGRCSSAARPCCGPPSHWSTRPSTSPPTCSRPTSTTSSSTPTTGTVGVAGVPATGLDWAALAAAAAAADGVVDHADGTHGPGRTARLPSGRGHVPVRRAHRRRRGRSATPARSRCCATSPSTTAAPC